MISQKQLKISTRELNNIQNRKLNEICNLAITLRLMVEVQVMLLQNIGIEDSLLK